MRQAIVIGGDEERVAAYLPANYRVAGQWRKEGNQAEGVLIEGEDVAGWTLEDYVIPRLYSGLMVAIEFFPMEEKE